MSKEAKEKEKGYSTSFKYPSESEFYRTKQAAAVSHMTTMQYVLQAVMKENERVLGMKK